MPGALAPEVAFLNHRELCWQGVKRARYLFYQHFHYAYPGPIRDLRHRLVVVPAARYGDQQLCDHHLRVAPVEVSTNSTLDAFGNRVFEFEAPRVTGAVSFEVLTELERTTSVHPHLTPGVDADLFLEPTALTEADARIRETALGLGETAADDRALAAAINTWVYDAMRYGYGATHVGTTAAQALATGQGLCQDYAHLMLALCRVAGLRARYVSGHMLAEGGSHAWVEVLLPVADGFEVVAYDPTNKRRPGLNYVTVAVGRDYRDVAPTSGSYQGSYVGQLTITKRAGLTAVEYECGQVVGDGARLAA